MSEGRFLFTFLINDLADVFTFADFVKNSQTEEKILLGVNRPSKGLAIHNTPNNMRN